ncbi:UNVERIFIED_CONTAM: soluble lytic murein transglycosylase [Acetivibrio alkalicellulosi]
MVVNRNRSKLAFIIIIILTILITLFMEEAVKLLYPLKYKEYVYKYSSLYENLDPYLVFSVIKAESGFDKDATSHKNARGLMQITDDTAIWIANRMNIDSFKVDQLYDAETNIRMGCWYLNDLMKQFMYEDGKYVDRNEETERKKLVLASYNAGRGNVTSWLENKNTSSDGRKLDRIPFKETEKYVEKVNKYYGIYTRLYKE